MASPTLPTSPAVPLAPKGWRREIPWGVAALMVIVAIVALWSPWRASRPPQQSPSRFVINLPEGQRLRAGNASAVAISPDGTKLVYAAREGGTQQLYLRRMGELNSEPIWGTEGGNNPYFSPDGNSVGFYAEGQVKNVSLQGGAPRIICPLPVSFFGGTWGPNDTNLFGVCGVGLSRMSAAGGTPEVVTSVLDFAEEPEGQHEFPQYLPGSEAILFTIWKAPEDISVAVRFLETGEQWTLIERGSHARYVPTGHLIYAWAGELLAVPFDLEELTVTGSPVPVLEGVMMSPSGAAHFSVSESGTLVYIPGDVLSNERTLVWVDRAGKVDPLPLPPGGYVAPRVSPDGKRLLFTETIAYSFRVYDLERGTLGRLTDGKGAEYQATWSLDGKRVIFNSNRYGGLVVNLHWKPSDGSGAAERLTTSEHHHFPESWSPDGKLLVFTEQTQATMASDIWMLPLEGDPSTGSGRAGTPRPLLDGPFNETSPALSPDGRWLAYASDELGRNEVYVQPYPGPGGIMQISINGGQEPLWAPDGRELYFRDSSGDKVMAVSFQTDPAFQVGKPRLLFEGRYSTWHGRNYDLAPDGQRFLMIQANEPELEATQIHVVLNWFEELKRRVPTQ